MDFLMLTTKLLKHKSRQNSIMNPITHYQFQKLSISGQFCFTDSLPTILQFL